MKASTTLILSFMAVRLFCQESSAYSTQLVQDTTAFEKVFILGLQGDISKALTFLHTLPDESLTPRQVKIKHNYYARFRHQNEPPEYRTRDTLVKDLLFIYRTYWKNALLDNANIPKYDSLLTYDVITFLSTHHPEAKEKSEQDLYENFPQYVREFLSERGIYAATGKTGMFFDLLLHAKETEVLYDVATLEQTIKVKVVFMEDIVSNGWEEYATFGRYFPGGWTTNEALYCVKETYDLQSEKFKVSYLAHEGKHFADYEKFPKLGSADLEYRAKLVELAYANETVFDLLQFFIHNSNPNKNDAHGLANYCVIRDLSKQLFNEEIVTNIKRWKTVPIESINIEAEMLLKANTQNLIEEGAETIHDFILHTLH